MADELGNTDAHIIVASLQTPEIFGAIFDRHAAAILRFACRRLGVDEAGNLVGEVFRIAFERRASFDAAEPNALPWLYGIATHVLSNHRRSESRRLSASAQLFGDGSQLTAREANLEMQLLLPKLVDELHALPAAERDALLLFALEGLSYDAIGAALAVPTGTVRSRIHRARRRLRNVLEGGVNEG